jgi:hypothetical protein
MDQYEAARKIKQLERYGPEVVGMCNGQGTTDLWISVISKVAVPAVVQKRAKFVSKVGFLTEILAASRLDDSGVALGFQALDIIWNTIEELQARR